MTPKETALDLIIKFQLIPIKLDDFDLRKMDLDSAKKCAIIAVNKIIEHTQTEISFWKSVKLEIEMF